MDDTPNTPERPDREPQPPQPPRPAEPVQPAQPAQPVETAPTPQYEPLRPRGGKVALLATLVAVIIAAGATIVVVRSGSDAPDLDALVPASAMVYFQANVDPSTDQKQALRRIVDRFPNVGKELGSSVERRLDEILSAATGLRYTRDVKPWLGSRAAIAVMVPELPTSRKGSGPGLPTIPNFVGLLAVEDEAAARTALGKVAARAGNSIAYEVGDGVAYVSTSASVISDLRAEAAKRALPAEDAYARALDKAGDTLGYAYVDGDRAKRLAQGVSGVVPGLGLGGIGSGPGGKSLVALRAEQGGIVVTGSTTLSEPAKDVKGGTPALTESAPAGTLAAITSFDPASAVQSFIKSLGQIIGNAQSSFSCLAEIGPDATQPSEERCSKRTTVRDPQSDMRRFAREKLGLNLDKDVYPWMHGEASVLFGGVSGAASPSLSGFDIGALIQVTNEPAARRTIAALRSRLGTLPGVAVTRTADGLVVRTLVGELIVRHANGRFVIATNDGYADTLQRGAPDRLGRDAVYRRLVGAESAGTVLQVYVRLDKVRQIVEAFLPPDARGEYDRTVGPVLRAFQGIAIRATQDSPTEGSFRLFLALMP